MHENLHIAGASPEANQWRFCVDELSKLAGLPRPPAITASAPKKLISNAIKPSITGGANPVTQVSQVTSPAALVPPPPISA